MAKEQAKREQKKCKECGESFFVKKPWQRFCKAKCKMRFFWKTHEIVKKDTNEDN